jgi:hypothetical protein
MQRIKHLVTEALVYLGAKILLFSLAISLLVAVSFLFTRDFNYRTYSDRLVWVGLFLFVLSLIVWLSVFMAGSQFGVTSFLTKPEEAKKYLKHQQEIRETVEKRYGTAIRIWLIGLVCIGLGALVQIVASKFV